MALTKVKAGNILLTTAAASSNDTTPATTQYVTTAINNLIDGAPATLNTLDEIAAALNDDAALNTTLTNAIAAKLPLAGGSLTGNLLMRNGGNIELGGYNSGNDKGLILSPQDGSGYWHIYNTAGGSLAFGASNTIGSSEKMRIAGSGNVGIGTDSPGHLLDILKTGSGDATVNIKSTTGGDPTIIFNSAAANRSGVIKYQDNGTNVGRIEYVHNGNRIDFQAGSATGATMSIINGKVSIAGATPQGNLTIKGAASDDIDLLTFSENGSDQSFSFNGNFAGSGSTGNNLTMDSYWTNDIMVWTGDGKVGIGTAGPNAPLTVWTASSASSQMALRLNNPGGFANVGAGAELIFSQDRSTSEDYRMAAITSGQQYAGSSSGADLKFWTRHSSSITNKMTLAADGTLVLRPSGVTTGLQLQGRSSDNNFFIQFNTNGGTANKASIGTDTGNNTLQYGADNHKFVNQATNATAMSIASTAAPRLHVGSGNQNGATGKRGIRTGRTIYNWFNYGKNEGHTYLHIKTNLQFPTGSNPQPTMSMLHIKGYSYSAESFDSMLGFHNWSGTIHQPIYTNNGTRTVVSSSWAPYRSSDNYVVIVLSIGNNYPGISIDWHQAFDPYTFWDIDVLGFTKNANTSGVY